jgi:hypothetical protein
VDILAAEWPRFLAAAWDIRAVGQLEMGDILGLVDIRDNPDSPLAVEGDRLAVEGNLAV